MVEATSKFNPVLTDITYHFTCLVDGASIAGIDGKRPDEPMMVVGIRGIRFTVVLFCIW